MRHFPTILKFLPQMLEPNPVLAREIKTRWRRPVVFLNLFLYAALMAFIMVVGYDSETSRLNLIDGQQAASAGRRMFSLMFIIQLMALMLIAPAISAPVIASERERGLLEALQLTELSARRLVWGKWLSVLGYLFIVVLISLPFATICFIFGGVSPAEFGLCLLVLTVSLLQLTALGLFVSSRSHRPTTAWRDVFVCIVVWAVWAVLYTDHRGLFIGRPLWLLQLGSRTPTRSMMIHLPYRIR